MSEKLEAVAAEAQRQLSLHRNCGCDDHAHHHRVEGGGVGGNGGGGGGVGGQAGVDRRKNRPKTASSPTQTEQVSSLVGSSLTMLTKCCPLIDHLLTTRLTLVKEFLYFFGKYLHSMDIFITTYS